MGLILANCSTLVVHGLPRIKMKIRIKQTVFVSVWFKQRPVKFKCGRLDPQAILFTAFALQWICE